MNTSLSFWCCNYCLLWIVSVLNDTNTLQSLDKLISSTFYFTRVSTCLLLPLPSAASGAFFNFSGVAGCRAVPSSDWQLAPWTKELKSQRRMTRFYEVFKALQPDLSRLLSVNGATLYCYLSPPFVVNVTYRLIFYIMLYFLNIWAYM